jgi:hypothetical protein
MHLYNHHKEVEKRFSASFFAPFFRRIYEKSELAVPVFEKNPLKKVAKPELPVP